MRIFVLCSLIVMLAMGCVAPERPVTPAGITADATPSGASVSPLATPPTDASILADLADAPPMLELLTFAAWSPDNRFLLGIGDQSAWYEATGVPRMASAANVQDWTEEDFVQFARMRAQTRSPQEFDRGYIWTIDMAGDYGFDLFNSVRYLSGSFFAIYPITVATVDASAALIGEKLLALGYVPSEKTLGTLYSLRPGRAIDLDDPSPLRRLGYHNHMFIINSENAPAAAANGETTVLVAASPEIIEAALDARANPSHSLLGDPYYSAVVALIGSAESPVPGTPVGITFVDNSTDFSPKAAMRKGWQFAQPDEVLEQWYVDHPMDAMQAAAYVGSIDKGEFIITVVAALPTSAKAEENAEVFAERLATWNGLVGEQQSDHWEVEGYGSSVVNRIPVIWSIIRAEEGHEGEVNWGIAAPGYTGYFATSIDN